MNLTHQNQNVQPIKDDGVLTDVQNALLNEFKFGRRNYTIFQVGKGTLLRVSDVLKLKVADVFDEYGEVRSRAYIKDQKTDKAHNIYLHPVAEELRNYRKWLIENDIQSQWLFPGSWDSANHVTTNQYYRVMQKVGQLLHLDYLGTHTMRKTGAYRMYVQSNYDIALVMKMLNHSSQEMTLRYLGIDQRSLEKKIDGIDFG